MVAQTPGGWEQQTKKEVRVSIKEQERLKIRYVEDCSLREGWWFDICATSSVFAVSKKESNHFLPPAMLFRSLLW